MTGALHAVVMGFARLDEGRDGDEKQKGLMLRHHQPITAIMSQGADKDHDSLKEWGTLYLNASACLVSRGLSLSPRQIVGKKIYFCE